MPEIVLFPRLAAVHGRRILEKPEFLPNTDPEALRIAAGPFVTWAASGGRRATSDELDLLRDGIVRIAKDCGYPSSGGQAERARFDTQASIFLVENNLLPTGEALRDDVWCWITLALVADVCLWRFEGAAPERFLGGRRNTLQRLWVRGKAFDRGVNVPKRWDLLERLTEDAMLQIIERPSIGADPRVATAIAEAWLKIADEIGIRMMEDLTRGAIRNIRITNEVLCLAALSDNELSTVIMRHFGHAASAFVKRRDKSAGMHSGSESSVTLSDLEPR